MSDEKIKIPTEKEHRENLKKLTRKEFDELLDSDCPHCKYAKKQERSRFREMIEKKIKEEQIKIIDSKALDPQKCEVHTGKINVLREILAEIDAEKDDVKQEGFCESCKKFVDFNHNCPSETETKGDEKK